MVNTLDGPSVTTSLALAIAALSETLGISIDRPAAPRGLVLLWPTLPTVRGRPGVR